jgi:hypothetical protein
MRPHPIAGSFHLLGADGGEVAGSATNHRSGLQRAGSSDTSSPVFVAHVVVCANGETIPIQIAIAIWMRHLKHATQKHRIAQRNDLRRANRLQPNHLQSNSRTAYRLTDSPLPIFRHPVAVESGSWRLRPGYRFWNMPGGTRGEPSQGCCLFQGRSPSGASDMQPEARQARSTPRRNRAGEGNLDRRRTRWGVGQTKFIGLGASYTASAQERSVAQTDSINATAQTPRSRQTGLVGLRQRLVRRRRRRSSPAGPVASR